MANPFVFMGKGGTASVAWVDAAGNADDVSIVADSYASSDETVATVAANAADPTKADITPVAPGTFNIDCKGTNRDGTVVSAETLAVDVLAPDATAGTISVTPNP